MIYALETIGLGKRYGSRWALWDCFLRIPVGRVAGLVGPNGAGKTTLLHLAMGLLEPTTGSVRTFGWSPREQPLIVLTRVGFVAQERPLYRTFTVKDMLTFARLERLGIPLSRPIGKLSGGQQAQVALILAIAKRPEMLLLDEPVANLDPLARREFLQTLMETVAQDGLTVLLSSHLIADLDRICDYMIILSASRVQVASDLEHLLQSHKRLVGPRQQIEGISSTHTLVQASHTERQSTLLVRTTGPVLDTSWDVQDVSLEDIILAYLAQPTVSMRPPELEHSRLEVSR